MNATRKAVALLIVSIFVLSLGSVSALAAGTPCVVTVTEESVEKNVSTFGTTNSLSHPPVTRAVVNLGTDGSRNYSWTISAGETLYSANHYKTESEKFVVRMLASPSSTSITVSLYSSGGSLVGSQTVTVGTIFQSKVTFSNLSSAESYYVKMTNNDQHSATISGTFAAK